MEREENPFRLLDDAEYYLHRVRRFYVEGQFEDAKLNATHARIALRKSLRKMAEFLAETERINKELSNDYR